jgi:hypothetical protein
MSMATATSLANEILHYAAGLYQIGADEHRDFDADCYFIDMLLD